MNRTLLEVFPLILSQAKRTENTFLHSDCAGLNVTGQWVINKCLKNTKRKKEKREKLTTQLCVQPLLLQNGFKRLLLISASPTASSNLWCHVEERNDKRKTRVGSFYVFTLLVKPRSFHCPSKEVHCPSYGWRGWEGAVEGWERLGLNWLCCYKVELDSRAAGFQWQYHPEEFPTLDTTAPSHTPHQISPLGLNLLTQPAGRAANPRPAITPVKENLLVCTEQAGTRVWFWGFWWFLFLSRGLT